MRVQVAEAGTYAYPDTVVVCGEPQFADATLDTLLNPTVIVEVLSPSTEGYDRGLKFEDYRTIPSLTDYVLVSQDKVLIEHYTRQPDDGWPSLRDFECLYVGDNFRCFLVSHRKRFALKLVVKPVDS